MASSTVRRIILAALIIILIGAMQLQYFFTVPASYMPKNGNDDGSNDNDYYKSWPGLEAACEPLEEDSAVSSEHKRLETDVCFHVEDLCFGSNQLFYMTDSNSSAAKKHQPSLDFDVSVGTAPHRFGYAANYSTSHRTPSEIEALGCLQSSVPYHVLLYSLYNDMLGEWYERSLLGLLEFLQKLDMPTDQFIKDSLLYIQRMDTSKPLMNSHIIFSQAFRSRPLGDLLQLFDTTPCQCLKQVFFCGYQIKPDAARPASNTNNTTIISNNRTTLVPNGFASQRYPLHHSRHHQLREFLRNRLVLENPLVVTAVQKHRQTLLQQHNIKNASEHDWKFIGMAQRSGRRRWQDLPQLMRSLSGRLQAQNVLLVEVNVEGNDWNPLQHLVRHAALDGLAGIHGAQLTEAIWMKPGSLVIELLPYVPKGVILGGWTATTHGPTPLGIMFDETDLLHVGYKLGRESAPYCQTNETLSCWQLRENRWDVRDFIAPAEAIFTMVDMFVINKPISCTGFEEKSKNTTHIVVYNAPCSQNGSSIGHYYWMS